MTYATSRIEVHMASRKATMMDMAKTREMMVSRRKGIATNPNRMVKVCRSLNNEAARRTLIKEMTNARPCISTNSKRQKLKLVIYMSKTFMYLPDSKYFD